MLGTETNNRNFLVLWKWKEALSVEGRVITGARGTHAGGLRPGDRIFVWATTGNELYVLGAINIKRGGKNWAEGQSVFGPFQIIPLKALKWRLRFQQTTSDKLSRDTALALQVRARRQPTPHSVILLEDLLANAVKRSEERILAHEGKQTQLTLSKRERNPQVRAIALAHRGLLCEICGFDFAAHYGEFARECVEVHHLKPLSSSGVRGTKTFINNLLVVCPNCHRALHRFGDPGEWQAFQRKCGLTGLA
jgi:5-methylcytosine-specific restriction endonuclease McrA